MSSAGSNLAARFASEAPSRREPSSTTALPPVSTRVIRDIAQLADATWLLTAAALACTPLGPVGVGPYILAGLAATLATTAVTSVSDLHALAILLSPTRRGFTLASALCFGATIGAGVLALAGERVGPVGQWTLGWLAFSATGLLCGRTLVRARLRHWQTQGRLQRKLAVVGVNELSAALIDRIDMTAPGANVVGLYVERDEDVVASQAGVPVLGVLDDLLLQVRLRAIDTIVVALPLVEQARVERICERLRDVACDVYLTADVVGLRYTAASITDIEGQPVIVVRQRPLKDWKGVQKRAFDLVLGWVLLVMLAPVMGAIALLIRFDSPGPVLFRQRRLGFNNNVITVFKFRTMFHHASDPLANRLTERNDPRITRLGGILRRLSLDELPQIFNVLNGEMSLVGPRPHALNAKAANRYYADVVAEYARRHVVKPGITGWAQVSGWRGETRTEEQIRQRVAYDLAYIERWSIGFDFKILWLTFVREVFSKHAF